MTKPTVICLTPIRNEAWILTRFLKCVNLWADHIIIADQRSNDGSREIAQSFPKVTLLDNPSPTFNEPEFRSMLIEAARRIPGPRLLIAIDADEALSANFMTSPEWNTVLQAPAGTIIRFQWANLRPDMHSYWLGYLGGAWGFMDDGSEYVTQQIHGPRIPEPIRAASITLKDLKILHYQYTNWDRMKSKQRWYQCWEKLNRSSRRPVKIYRMYHLMDAIPQNEISRLPREWLSGYEEQGIDMTSVYGEVYNWQDLEVLEWMSKHGTEKFKKLPIWDVNWSDVSIKLTSDAAINGYDDPRSWFDKLIHYWLRQTQPLKNNLFIRIVDKLLGLIGW